MSICRAQLRIHI